MAAFAGIGQVTRLELGRARDTASCIDARVEAIAR